MRLTFQGMKKPKSVINLLIAASLVGLTGCQTLGGSQSQTQTASPKQETPTEEQIAQQEAEALAREKAEAEAAENVAEAMQQIAEADEVIAEAALHLKPEKRSIVAGIRRTIPAILRRIERGLRQGKPLDPRGDANRSTSGDEEKF